MTQRLIAHVRKNDDGSWDVPHDLVEHLTETAELAAGFAKPFNSADWAYATGFAHDAGKSTAEWQDYLKNKSGYGYDEDAHLEENGRLDHSSPSAKIVKLLYGDSLGHLLAYAISGHHAGLPDWDVGDQKSLWFRLQQKQAAANSELITEEIRERIVACKPQNIPWQFEHEGLGLSLWLRMLFSCLVDADFLSTERYMTPKNADTRSNYCSIEQLLERFNVFMAEKSAKSTRNSINALRETVLANCRDTGKRGSAGVYSLTVPTGGGKTLSSLAFGLEHALANNLNRIIYVIPYTSIIEQNADVFCEALGSENVVEHHSNLDPEKVSAKARLAAENWDAPVIVTTTVQFFESLFAAKPSRCRKLHNICNSVVVFDEAQLAPLEHLSPILNTVNLLATHYKTTFVISTATQPVWESRQNFEGLPPNTIKEIIQDVPALFDELKRVHINYPDDYKPPVSWEELAEELMRLEQVLCIVPTRKNCRDLHRLLPSDFYHLSALMCGQHRSDVITEIKTKLENNQRVRVISTNLVEAGVDIDFPVVYKALAGMDSIAQAAGRCNREGKLPGMGEVHIFIPPQMPPPGALRKAAETTKSLLETGQYSPLELDTYEKFFSQVISKANTLDKADIVKYLTPGRNGEEIQFRTAAKEFKLIDDCQQYSIIVPYGDGDELIELLKRGEPDKWLLRKLQRYTVSIYERDYYRLSSEGRIIEVYPQIFACLINDYDLKTGLKVDDEPYGPDELIL
jgi:CRISPR-associated endonuclease/helicase Cas3